MEKIQERALRFIYNDYVLNYEELLEKSKMPSLKVRRLRSIAIETFKIIHKESPIYLHDLVNIKKHNYSFRYENTADVPSVKTTRYGLKSFRYFSTKLWNELPNHIRLEQNLNQFSNYWIPGMVAHAIVVLACKQFVLLCFVYLVLYSFNSFNITLSWSAIMLLDSVLINFIWNCIYVWMSLLLCMSMYAWAYVLCF